jgi:hypothetical protein
MRKFTCCFTTIGAIVSERINRLEALHANRYSIAIFRNIFFIYSLQFHLNSLPIILYMASVQYPNPLGIKPESTNYAVAAPKLPYPQYSIIDVAYIISSKKGKGKTWTFSTAPRH